jgi:hypothetical protein
MSFDMEPERDEHDECAHEIDGLKDKVVSLEARIKALRMALCEAAGATHSHHGEIEDVKDCEMASCQKATAALANDLKPNPVADQSCQLDS